MIEPLRTEVDGITTFWVDTGRPTLAAQLIIRTGAADERLPESGWTHLLEHVTLHGTSRPGPLDVNGSVGLLTTSFTAHGPIEAVTQHLAEVTRRLGEPVDSDLDRERQVLAAEARLRGGPVERALAQRYGARGPGTVSYGELGLAAASSLSLSALATRAFTAGNAVLVLDGPPPPELVLHLPDGPHLPVPQARPVETNLPAMYVEESGLVASGVVPRSSAAMIFAELARESLTDLLRHDKAAAYAPWTVYERVDTEHAVVVAGSDVAPGLLPTLANTAISWSRGRHYDTAGVQAQVERLVQTMTDPYATAGHAAAAAHAWLLDREERTTEELLSQVRDVSDFDVAVVADTWCRSLLLGIPGDTTWNDQMRRSAPRLQAPRRGRVHRHRNWPAVRGRLVVTNDGVVQTQARRGALAHAFEPGSLELVGYADDGRRYLVDAEGWPLVLDPRAWARGDAAVRAVDAATPPHVRVPLPRDESTPWRRASPWLRWTHRLRGRVRLTWPMAGRIAVALALLSPLSLLFVVPLDEFPPGSLPALPWLAVAAFGVLVSSAFEPD
ncbi:hypothetical protein [Aeromicrobium sp.]|uniref:hypothetical protein n=1 Tax=Aeromicrobium sp. TaxID=1871063 RepID=UPI0040341647